MAHVSFSLLTSFLHCTVTFANGVTPTIFWDKFHNVLVFVTDVWAFQFDAEEHEPLDEQPEVVVRLYSF